MADCWVACWAGCWVEGCLEAGCWVEGCSEAVCCRTAGVGCWVEGCLEVVCCTSAGVGCWAEGCWVAGCSEAACCTTAGVGCWAEDCWVADCLEEPCTCSQPSSRSGLLQSANFPSSLAAMLAPQAIGEASGWKSYSCEHQQSTPQRQTKHSASADTQDAVDSDVHGSRKA